MLFEQTLTSPPIRVLVVSGFREEALPSGEEVVATSQLDCLARSEHMVATSCFIRINRSQTLVKQFINLFWSIDSRQALKKAIIKTNPDIVHFHSIYPILSFSAVRLAKKMGKKTVVTLHNERFVCAEGAFFRKGKFCDDCLHRSSFLSVWRRCVNGSVLKSLALFVLNYIFIRCSIGLRWIDKCVAVSPFIYETHRFIPHEKLTVIRNSIKKQPYVNNFDKQTVVFAGRLSIAKGFDHFLQACRSLPHIQFVAIGYLDGEIDIPKDLGNFTYLDTMSHEALLAFLGANASLVAMLSVCSESFSLMAHEALSFGIPIVTSQFGFLPTVVNESQAGVAVDVFKKNELSKAISRVLDDKLFYDTLSRRGQSYIDAYVSEQLICDQYNAHYQAILAT